MQNVFSKLFDDNRRYRGKIVGDLHQELDLSRMNEEDLVLEFSRYQVIDKDLHSGIIHVIDSDQMITFVDLNSVEEITTNQDLTFDLSTTSNEKIDDDILKKYNIKETSYSREYNRDYEISLKSVSELLDLCVDLGNKIIIIPNSVANKNSHVTNNVGVLEIYDTYRE